MPKIHFSDLTIRSLSEGLYFDDRLSCFAIRVGKNRKTWMVIKDRMRAKVRLGHYPALSLAEARKRALRELASPTIVACAPGFCEARTRFLAQNKWRPRTKYQINRILHLYFDWAKPIDRITAQDVSHASERIGKPSEALHAFRYIRAFFNWCVPRYLSLSPCRGLKAPSREKSRDRVLADPELLRVWMRAEEIGYPYGTICQLLITTGQRRSEVASLHWEWIREGAITLPASITKNGRETRIPYGPLTASIIDSVPKLGPLLFPARGYPDKPFQGFGASKLELDKCGVPCFTHHDFRRTYATNMAALGVPIHVVEKLLNHASGTLRGVAAIYNRFSYWEEMKDAVEKWERRLQSLTGLRQAA